MKIYRFHSWGVTPREAVKIQEQLRIKVIAQGRVLKPKLVAGADAALDLEAGQVCAAVVVLTFPSLEPVETVVHWERLSFPYIPGLLSFREAPALLHAFEKVRHNPDVIFIDGQGLSHPRSAGIACHLGVCLNKPTIGCAKSLLVGTYRAPGLSRGAASSLYDANGRVIGAIVRTRDRVRPIFVSVGHRLGLAEAVRLTLASGKGYRIPEPTRQADLLAERAKREDLGSR
ncbi:MAG: deoxyribonuclease V [Nitrospira sp.]